MTPHSAVVATPTQPLFLWNEKNRPFLQDRTQRLFIPDVKMGCTTSVAIMLLCGNSRTAHVAGVRNDLKGRILPTPGMSIAVLYLADKDFFIL